MTLRRLRSAISAAGQSLSERRLIRSLLRKASRGNALAFVQAAAHYVNFISEYLYLAGTTDSTERLFQTQKILRDCWRYLPYTRRVSDFERFLQVSLERHQANKHSALPVSHAVLGQLDHRERFLLAARTLESWTHKSLRLALRCSSQELSVSLMELKCKLVSFDSKLLRKEEQEQVQHVSDLLEGVLSCNAARSVEKQLGSQYHAHQFKADWLAYRCELADLRLTMIPSSAEKSELSERVIQLIKQQPMERPGLADSLINQISFVRLPSR